MTDGDADSGWSAPGAPSTRSDVDRGDVESDSDLGGRDVEFSLDQSIGFLVYRAQLAMRAELGRRFHPHDVTPEQWAVLARLWQEDGLRQRELAERTFKDAANTTRIVQKLERKGFVTRRPAPGDRRANTLHLTAHGEALVRQLIPRAQELLTSALAGVGDEEAAVARRVMNAIVANIRAGGVEP